MSPLFRKTACLLLLTGVAVLVFSHLWMFLERAADESNVDNENYLADRPTLEGHVESWKALGPMEVDRSDTETDDIQPKSPVEADLGDSSRDYNQLVDSVVNASEGTQRSVALQEASMKRTDARLVPAANMPVDKISTLTLAAVAGPVTDDSPDRLPNQRADRDGVPTTTTASNEIDANVGPAAGETGENVESLKVDRVGVPRDSGSRRIQADIDSDESPSNGLVNVVSMSLYGSDPRYVNGAIRNAQLIRKNFPGWQLWVYVESSESSRYPAVPTEVINRLVDLGADVHYVTPQDDFVPPMMWRFLVADDPAVDRFIVRDSDSRLTRRDSASVAAWIKSGRSFHCVRDHPSHAGYALSGGLWGGRAPALRQLMRRSWAALMRGVDEGYLNDMNFLNNVVWPRVEKVAFCTDSVSCDRWTGAVPFPVTRQGYEHVGQVYDENDVGRQGDIKILEQAGENRDCVPRV